jgi:hypothetical protein
MINPKVTPTIASMGLVLRMLNTFGAIPSGLSSSHDFLMNRASGWLLSMVTSFGLQSSQTAEIISESY